MKSTVEYIGNSQWCERKYVGDDAFEQLILDHLQKIKELVAEHHYTNPFAPQKSIVLYKIVATYQKELNSILG